MHMIRLALAAALIAFGLPAFAGQPSPVTMQIDRSAGKLCAYPSTATGQCVPLGTIGASGFTLDPFAVSSISKVGGVFFAAPFFTDLNCVTDQSGKLQTALTTAGINAYVILPPGCIGLGAPTTALAGQRIDGGGKAQTRLNYTASSGAALAVVGPGAAARDLYFTNTTPAGVAVANSQATAIQLGDSSGTNDPGYQTLRDIHTEGFRDAIDVQSGQFWSVLGSYVHDASRYPIRIRNGVNGDSGDGLIGGGTVIASDAGITGNSAIRYESGGGLKVTSTKVLGHDIGVDLRVADNTSTSDLLVDPSVSIEGQNIEGVHLGRLGTNGAFGNIQVYAQISGSGLAQSSGVHVSDGVYNVKIGGMQTGWPIAVNIDGGDQIAVQDANMIRNVTTGVSSSGTATNVQLGRFSCVACVNRVLNSRIDTINQTDGYKFSITGSAPTYLYKVGVSTYQGVEVAAHVQGIVQGIGEAQATVRGLVSNNNGVATFTQVSSTSDPGGANLALTMSTTKNAGALSIGVNATNGAQFDGTLNVTAEGNLASFSRINTQ